MGNTSLWNNDFQFLGNSSTAMRGVFGNGSLNNATSPSPPPPLNSNNSTSSSSSIIMQSNSSTSSTPSPHLINPNSLTGSMSSQTLSNNTYLNYNYFGNNPNNVGISSNYLKPTNNNNNSNIAGNTLNQSQYNIMRPNSTLSAASQYQTSTSSGPNQINSFSFNNNSNPNAGYSHFNPLFSAIGGGGQSNLNIPSGNLLASQPLMKVSPSLLPIPIGRSINNSQSQAQNGIQNANVNLTASTDNMSIYNRTNLFE